MQGQVGIQNVTYFYNLNTAGSEFSIQMIDQRLEAKWYEFKCHLNTRQPDHLNTRLLDAILFSYALVWYSNGPFST